MSNLRQMVLQSFKKLHRTRLKVFNGDTKALTAARLKINEEYSNNKYVKNEDSIRTMIKFSDDVETELRTKIIQAKEVKPGVYEAKITDNTVMLENFLFDPTAVPDEGIKRTKRSPCCKNEKQ